MQAYTVWKERPFELRLQPTTGAGCWPQEETATRKDKPQAARRSLCNLLFSERNVLNCNPVTRDASCSRRN
jgi:hypothetical protein